MIIKKFEPKYRDDLIFMVLEAKNALGRVPRLNEDLLDVEKNYLDKGDMFWIAVDGNDCVVGSVGYKSIGNGTEIHLHRLYVKSSMKRQGIGTRLLKTAEEYAKSCGKTAVYVHLGKPKEQWFESYNFYPQNGYYEYEANSSQLMKKNL